MLRVFVFTSVFTSCVFLSFGDSLGAKYPNIDILPGEEVTIMYPQLAKAVVEGLSVIEEKSR